MNIKELEFIDSSLKKLSFVDIATELINIKKDKNLQRNIWLESKWKNICELENDDVGKVGEEIINELFIKSSIKSSIDGIKNKNLGIDGKINGKTVEIKTARLGSNNETFQHELGETPWKANFILFLDIAPLEMYITIFPNFPEDFYKKSGCDSSLKCEPYFPTKSITWRKQKGAFKLDTTLKINKKNKYTFMINDKTNDYQKLKNFVNSIIKID